MEVALILFGLLVVGVIGWVVAAIPVALGRQRGISESDLSTVRILSILGVLTVFVTWFIALFLAAIYPVAAQPSQQSQPSQPAFPVVPLSPSPQPEQCANCGRIIGQLETPMVWGNNVVCRQCHQLLS